MQPVPDVRGDAARGPGGDREGLRAARPDGDATSTTSPPTSARSSGIEQLPETLGEAIEEMAGSELVLKALGEHVFTRYVDLKRAEWEDYRVQVSRVGAGAVPVDALARQRVPTLVERMRRVHQKMVDAALTGDGFDRMAELAAEEIGRPVGDRGAGARRVAVVWPAATTTALAALAQLHRGARRRAPRDDPGVDRAGRPDLVLGRPSSAASAMLAGGGERGARRERVPAPRRDGRGDRASRSRRRASATRSAQARRRPRAASRTAAPRPTRRCAPRGAAGFDLAGGLVVLGHGRRPRRPHEARGADRVRVAGSARRAGRRPRVYALVPAARGGPPGALGTVEGLAARLRAYGPTGTSSRYGDADELRPRGRARPSWCWRRWPRTRGRGA